MDRKVGHYAIMPFSAAALQPVLDSRGAASVSTAPVGWDPARAISVDTANPWSTEDLIIQNGRTCWQRTVRPFTASSYPCAHRVGGGETKQQACSHRPRPQPRHACRPSCYHLPLRGCAVQNSGFKRASVAGCFTGCMKTHGGRSFHCDQGANMS